MGILLIIMSVCPVYAASMTKEDTPDYKVAFYAFDCYHIKDDNGKLSGYGYEMIRGISKYLQCTFSYVEYDKSASECEELLREGKLDIYTETRRKEGQRMLLLFGCVDSILKFLEKRGICNTISIISVYIYSLEMIILNADHTLVTDVCSITGVFAY